MDGDVLTFSVHDRSTNRYVTLTAPTPERRTGLYAAVVMYRPDGTPYIHSVTASADPVPERG